MEGIDDDLEDEILWRVANRADRSVSIQADGKPSSQHEPSLYEAMQLTGSYVSWVRENAIDGMSTIEMTDDVKHRCTRLGKFVAHLRARPSIRQEEVAEREFASRLVSQLVRLAKCLALVLNRRTVDEEVLRRVRQVALDTSRGQTLALANYLYDHEDGLPADTLVMYLAIPTEKLKALLRFLKMIHVVEPFVTEIKGVRSKVKWRLTRRMRKLFTEVMEPIYD
jgi:hypothetical protein